MVSLCTAFVLAAPVSAASNDTWQIAGSPNTNNPYNLLTAVTCVSADKCWAVGYSNPGNEAQTLVERYTAGVWSIVSSPSPSAGRDNVLNGVACVGDEECWAVGYYQSSSAYQTLVEHYAGGVWSVVSSPDTGPAERNVLKSVACVSSADCWAVGDSTNGTLIERWDGVGWSIVSSPNPNPSTLQYNVLNGVACMSSTDCWAVGYYSNGNLYQTLIEQDAGTGWAIISSPSTSQYSYLNGVTCVSASDCWAVGVYENGVAYDTLAEHDSGTGWAIVSSPDATPAIGTSSSQQNVLNSVSCVSAVDCWAVGWYSNGGSSQTLIVQYTSSGWAIVGSPSSSAAENNLLTSVVCDSTDCWSVGYYYASNSIVKTLIERYAVTPANAVPDVAWPPLALITIVAGGVAARTILRILDGPTMVVRDNRGRQRASSREAALVQQAATGADHQRQCHQAQSVDEPCCNNVSSSLLLS